MNRTLYNTASLDPLIERVERDGSADPIRVYAGKAHNSCKNMLSYRTNSLKGYWIQSCVARADGTFTAHAGSNPARSPDAEIGE